MSYACGTCGYIEERCICQPRKPRTITEMFVESALERIDEDLAHLGGDHPKDRAEYLDSLLKALAARRESVGVESRTPPT